MTDRQLKITRWTARIGALIVLIGGLPFYFGYGNPLPFVNPDNSLGDNAWLTAFPIMFLGLALGLRWERLGGWLVLGPICLGLMISLIDRGEVPGHMFVPLLIGGLFLLAGGRSKTD